MGIHHGEGGDSHHTARIPDQDAATIMARMIAHTIGIPVTAEAIEKLIATKWETLNLLAHAVHRRVT